MSKAALYVTSRTGSRPSLPVRENAWQHFLSTGGMAGSPELAAEIANRALENRFLFVMRDNRDGTVTLKRCQYVEV